MIKIGELSKITGTPIQTIRFYESEGLISPIEVDRWTNYRYYDESSIIRLSEIQYLKDLGFSLKEISNLSEDAIKEKIAKTELDIEKLTNNIDKLSTIRKKTGGFFMKNFVNDERVIGKWKKLAIVKAKEDFLSNNFDDPEIFDFNELYFLPNGEEYWVFSWTKDNLYLKDGSVFPYEIIDNKLYISIVDSKTNTIDNYAVYEQVNNKQYSKQEIMIKDNTNIPFIKDDNVIGFWECVDYVRDFSQFNLSDHFWSEDLLFKRYSFEPDGTLVVTYKKDNALYQINWSKGVVINKNVSTVSEYTIKTINGNDCMFVEWKSGDYTFGGEVHGFYVFKRMK